MREIKRTALRIFLVVEVVVFAGFYMFGSHGITATMALRAEMYGVEKEIVALKNDIATLEHQMALQKECPFYKEKIAREQLQMAHADEEIYIL